jgi:hypothetical protein
MLPLSSESISQIKLLQHTNAAYLFNVQRIVTQNAGFCDQCVHELFCYVWAGEFTPKGAPTFSETPCIYIERGGGRERDRHRLLCSRAHAAKKQHETTL